MKLVYLIFAVLIPLSVGYLAVTWITSRDRESAFFERLSLGYGLGAGIVTYVMFILGLLRIPYSLPSIILPLAAISAFFVFLIRRGGGGFLRPARLCPSHTTGLKLAASALLIAWMLFKVAFVLYENSLRPIFAWDAWVHWSTGAKVFYYAKGLLLDPSSENFFGKSYRFIGHPVHTPLLEVWHALLLGEFDESLVKTWSAFYYTGMIGIVYFTVRREAGAFAAIASAFFLTSLPLPAWHATESYSDLVLASYALSATVVSWRYMRGLDKRYLALAGVFLAMCSTTKNEGIFFFAAVASALILYNAIERRSYLSDSLFFILPFAILAGPWFVFKAVYGLGFGHGGEGAYGSELTWLSDPTFGPTVKKGIHWEIIPGMLRYLFLSANFNLVFPFWLFLTVFNLWTVIKTEIKYLHLISMSAMGMFVFVYLIFEVVAVIGGSGINRNTLTYVPLFLLSSALLFVRITDK